MMVRDFHMNLGFVLDELPLGQAFALKAWGTEANPWAPVRRVSDGYIAQEAQMNHRGTEAQSQKR